MNNSTSFPYEDLPENTLALIASFLCIHDLRNFRLTCTRLYEVSFYKEVLLHQRVVAKKFEPTDAPIFAEYLDKVQYGRFLPVYVHCNNLSRPVAEDIAMNLKYVVELSFDMRYTEYIEKYCPYLKKLTWISTLQNINGQSDKILLKQCLHLKNIERLQELIVQGTDIYFDYPRFPASIVKCINDNMASLCSLTFNRLYFVRDESVPFDKLKIDNTCIPNWKFHYVYMLGDFFVKLPNTLKSLECFFAEDVRWVNKISNLESIGLDGSSIPRDWSDVNYRKLQHLTLNRIKFLTMYPPLCKHLRSLKLIDCSHTMVYLKLLSSFTESVEKLVLDSVYGDGTYKDMDDFRDYQITLIINNMMPQLQILVLRNFDAISPRILPQLTSTSLREVVIINCKMFSSETYKGDPGVTYPFKLVVNNKCNCA